MTCEEARRVEAIKRENMTALERYRRQLRENPRLLYLFFELTDACNLSGISSRLKFTPSPRRMLTSYSACAVSFSFDGSVTAAVCTEADNTATQSAMDDKVFKRFAFMMGTSF